MPAPQAEPKVASPTRTADEIRAWIVAEVARSTRVAPADVAPSAPLTDHGVDSLGAISMTGGLAAWLGRDVPATLMWDYPTIDAIAAGLADAAPPPLPEGVVAFNARGDRPPLFCFPGVGGHPTSFASLAAHLGDAQPCFGLLVPGLHGEHAPLTGVEAIASAMVKSLRRVQPSGPYQLAGYSFGGLLAYEAARQLSAAGERVAMLALFDTFAPAGRTARPLWQRLGVHAHLLATRPGRLAYLRDRLRGLRAALDGEADAAAEYDSPDANVRAVAAANRAAALRYNPGPYAGTATFLHAGVRPTHHRFYKSDPAGGWVALCAGGVRVVALSAGHLRLLDADHSREAADALRPFLA